MYDKDGDVVFDKIEKKLNGNKINKISKKDKQ